MTLPKIPSFISAFTAGAEPRGMPERVNRLSQMHRRRIDDILEEAFKHACLTGDLDTASDVIGLLDRKYARWMAKHGTDRRAGGQRITRLRDELDRRQRIRLTETGGRPG